MAGPAAEGAGAGAIGNHGAPAPATDGAAGGCQHTILSRSFMQLHIPYNINCSILLKDYDTPYSSEENGN